MCKGLLIYFCQQQLADSFDKLNQDLHNELNWLSDVEQLLKDDQPVSEEAYKAQCQREAMKVSSSLVNHVRIQRGGGGRGSGPSLKNHKNIGFLSNTGPDPLENHKATKPAFNVGPSSASQLNAI